MYLAGIYVTLKPVVNDPQGRTVLGALKSLGFASAEDVCVGKYLEVRVNEPDRARAEATVAGMCQKLLALILAITPCEVRSNTYIAP